MAESLKDKAQEVGHKVAETANKVGHKVGEKMEEAADWAKEKAHQIGDRIEEGTEKVKNKVKETFGEGAAVNSMTDIREHMAVIASCGKTIGKVDHVDGDQIKLTKNDSSDGRHHLIPMSWVDHVDDHVHLNRNSEEAEDGWKTV